MRNIEFRLTNEFGENFSEKLDGRSFTRFVAKEAKERNVRENQVINDFIKNLLDKYLSKGEITSYEFTWLDEFNRKHKIEQYNIVLVNKETYSKVQREINSNSNKYKYNYYDYTNGKELFNEWYEWVDIFRGGLAIVEREDDGDYLCNFIDKNGKILSEEWFKWLDFFHDGFARVQRFDDKFNFINKQGKFLFNEWFRWVDYFDNDGLADVERTNGEMCKIDKNGKIVVIK